MNYSLGGVTKKFIIIFQICFLSVIQTQAQTYSTFDNYSWVTEGFRFSYQLKDSEGKYTTIFDNKTIYFNKEGRNANEIEETFSSALPSSGTYTGSKFIWKAWLVKG